MDIIQFIRIIIFLASVSYLGALLDYLLHYLCGLRGTLRPSLGRLPLCFALGAGGYTFYGALLSTLGFRASLINFAALFFFILSLALILYHKASLKESLLAKASGPQGPYLIRAAIAISVLLLLANMVMAMALPHFDIDMLGHILIKAKVFTNDTYQSSSFFNDDIFANAHPRYPPFAGIFYNLLFLFGARNISSYQVINYFILFLTAMAIHFYLKGKVLPWQDASWFFIFISSRPYLASQFITSSVDVVLALYFLLTVLALLEPSAADRQYHSLLCMLLLGLGTLVKNEGLVFSMITIPVYLVLNGKRGLRYLIAWMVITLPWVLYRSHIPNPALSSEFLLRNADLGFSLQQIGRALNSFFVILFREWNTAYLMAVMAVFILCGRQRSYRRQGAVIFTLLSGLVLAYVIVVWLHIGRADEFELNGFYRVLSQAYPLAIILLALAASQLKDKTPLPAKGFP